MMEVSNKAGIPTSLAYLLVFGLAVLTIVWRFLPWMPSVFYGDDLDYLLLFKDGQCATRAAEVLTTTCYERYRPVASAFVIAMMNLFGHQLEYYLAVNVVIQGVIGLLVFMISQRLSRGNTLISLLVALAAVTSRFATYQVTQMIGPVESVTLALCLGMVYSTIRADTDPASAWRWCWLALLCSFLAMHTHERSMVTAVWLGFAFVLSPSILSLPRRRWLVLLAACLALPAYYIALKTFVLQAHFLLGTGGTHIDFGLPLIVDHATTAMRSLLGFNTGPDYLVGASVSLAWPAALALAMMLSLTWLVLLVGGIRSAAARRDDVSRLFLLRLRWPLLLLALAAALLAPSLLTVRLEQRWLLAPFVVGLLMAAWAAGSSDGKSHVRTSLVMALCLASITLDTLIARHFDRIFFIASPRYAALVKRDVIDPKAGQPGDIALLAGADQCNWTLARGGFFRIYGGKARSVHCFATPDEVKLANLPIGTPIYAPDEKGALIDITERERSAAQASHSDARVDFMDIFDRGQLNDDAYVATPTGRGSLLLQWNTDSGTRQTLTILTGFEYRYDAIPIMEGDVLRFGIAMIHPATQSARAIIRVQTSGQAPEVLYHQDLTPPPAGNMPSFIDVQIPLQPYAGQNASLSFSVESPGGNPTAHWVGFADPHIGGAKLP